MKRDLANLKRDLENRKNNDIIYKKDLLEKMFNEDPDIKEVLGSLEKRPLNKFIDAKNPTEEELAKRKEIEDYNEKISKKRIVPYLKLNGIQKEVNNFLMFDIDDSSVSYNNKAIKNQQIIVMCLVHENDMDTEYGIQRTDLLSYLVKDILNWTNALGAQFMCVNDFNDIIDSKYYCRTLKFEAEVPNVVPTHMGMHNRYDQFRKI